MAKLSVTGNTGSVTLPSATPELPVAPTFNPAMLEVLAQQRASGALPVGTLSPELETALEGLLAPQEVASEAPVIEPQIQDIFNYPTAEEERPSAVPFSPTEPQFNAEGNPLNEEQKQQLYQQELAFQEEVARQNERNYQYETQKEFDEIYRDDFVSPVRSKVFNFSRSVSNAINTLPVSVEDETGKLDKGSTAIGILERDFNAPGVEVVNALSESAAEIFVSMTASNDTPDFDSESDPYAALSGLSSETNASFRDSAGRIGAEEESFKRRLGRLTSSRITEARGTQSRGDTSVSNQVGLQALESEGYVVKGMEQPVDAKTGAPKGPSFPAIFLTSKGLQLSRDIRGFGNPNKILGGAQALSGGQTKHIGEVKYVTGSRDKQRAGSDFKTIDGKSYRKGESLMDDFYNSYTTDQARRHNLEVLAIDETLLELANPQTEVQPEEQEAASLAQKIFKIKPNTESAMQNYNKYSRDIRSAKALSERLPGGHKPTAFSDPSSRRMYNGTFDSNEQASLIHRGTLQGRPSRVSLAYVPANPKDPLVNRGMMKDFDRWLRNPKSSSNSMSKYVSSMAAIMYNLGQGTRNTKLSDFLPTFNLVQLKGYADKGYALREILEQKANSEASVEPMSLASLSPESNGLVMDVLKEIAQKDVRKEHGLVINAYLAAADMADAISSGSTSVNLRSIPLAGDMSSAGRFFSSTDVLDSQTISRLGYGLDSVIDKETREANPFDAFPLGNPRRYYADILVEILENRSSYPDNDNTFNVTIANVFKTHLNGDEGNALADSIGKLSLMVVDYGKPASQNLDETLAFVNDAKDNYPEFWGEIVKAAESSGKDGQDVVSILQETMRDTTKSLTSPWNSHLLKTLTETLSLLNETVEFPGVRGIPIRIGRKEYPALPNSFVEIAGTRVPLKSEIAVDLPTKAAEPKWIESAQKWYIPGVATAAKNAIGPAIGHAREMATSAIALEKTKEKMGEIPYLGFVHDQAILDPESALVFFHNVNENATFEVIEANYVNKFKQFFNQKMADLVTKFPRGGLTELGVQGEYFGWTNKLDESLDYLVRSIESNNGVLDRNNMRQLNVLREAYDAKIWAPESLTQVNGAEFSPRPVGEKTRVVKNEVFLKWLVKNFINPNKENMKRWVADSDIDRTKLINEMRQVDNKAFMSPGR